MNVYLLSPAQDAPHHVTSDAVRADVKGEKKTRLGNYLIMFNNLYLWDVTRTSAPH